MHPPAHVRHWGEWSTGIPLELMESSGAHVQEESDMTVTERSKSHREDLSGVGTSTTLPRAFEDMH